MPSNTTTVCTQVAQFNSKVVVYDAQGVKGSAKLNTTTNIDLKMRDDEFLTGGALLVKFVTFGDYCDMQVVDADGILKGVPSPYGVNFDQLPGYPVLNQFVTSYYLDDTTVEQGDFDLPYPAKIFTGLYLRVVYHSTSTMAGMLPQVALNYRLHKVLA